MVRSHCCGSEHAEGKRQDHRTERAQDRNPEGLGAALDNLSLYRGIRRKHTAKELDNAWSGREQAGKIHISCGEGPEQYCTQASTPELRRDTAP